MMPLRIPTVFAVFVAAIGITLVACSGGKSGTPPTAPAGASTAVASPASSGSATAVASPGATEPAGGTPGATGPVDAAATAAAETVFHGAVSADCSQATPDASAPTCLESLSMSETIAAGISAWRVTAQGGGSSYTGVLGRMADGSWKLWFSSQDVIWLIALPGTMRVCADGQGLNLRNADSATAPRVASIADNTLVAGDKFVLTEPGTPTQQGYGWYHLTTNPDGWAYSKYLVDSTQPNCNARNKLVNGG